MIQHHLQDYSLINTYVEKRRLELVFDDLSSAFYFFTLDLLFALQDDEIDEAITDTNYLRMKGLLTGHDRSIGAVFIHGKNNFSGIKNHE